MRLDNACANFMLEVATKSSHSCNKKKKKNILNKAFFNLNHKLNIFNFQIVKCENSEGTLKLKYIHT